VQEMRACGARERAVTLFSRSRRRSRASHFESALPAWRGQRHDERVPCAGQGSRSGRAPGRDGLAPVLVGTGLGAFGAGSPCSRGTAFPLAPRRVGCRGRRGDGRAGALADHRGCSALWRRVPLTRRAASDGARCGRSGGLADVTPEFGRRLGNGSTWPSDIPGNRGGGVERQVRELWGEHPHDLGRNVAAVLLLLLLLLFPPRPWRHLQTARSSRCFSWQRVLQ
jgi:hypothetical protein